MQLSRFATDALFAGVAGFAHRGLHGPGVPENSMAAFGAAIAAGAGIECDLRLSRDGSAMIFHDPDLQRLCGTTVETESLNAAALTTFRLGGTGQAIPTLSRLLNLVAGQVPLLLEVKTRRRRRVPGVPPAPVDALCRAVAADLAGYGGAVGVMSFDPRVPAWFARHQPHWARGLVIGDCLPAWRRWTALQLAQPDFLAVETSAALRPWAVRQRTRRAVASWTVRTAEQRQALSDRVDALIWESDGRP